MEKAISMMALAVGASLVLLVILIGTKRLGPNPVSPNPVVAHFEVNENGEMWNLVVGNSGEEIARGILIVIFDGKEEHNYWIDVEINPHNVIVLRLNEHIPEEMLKKAKLIDVYYNNTIIARRIVEGK